MTFQSIQVALIGAGGIARAHIAAARQSEGRVRVAAVVDPSEAARSAARDAAGGVEAFDSIEAFLGSPVADEVRGVVVCTPPSIRIPIVSKALERGLGVLVEKPIAHTLADAEALQQLAERHAELVTAVGYCHRFVPAINEIKRRMEAGAIGTITRFENTFAAHLPRMREHWMSDRAISGGGSFIDTGCHSLDLFLYLLGPATVEAAVFHHAWAGRAESSSSVMVRSAPQAGGVAGVIQTGWLEPARFLVTVVGTDGLLQYDYDRPAELLHRPATAEAQIVPVEPHSQRFGRQLECFAAAVTGDKAARARLASFADGVETARAVDAVMRQAAERNK